MAKSLASRQLDLHNAGRPETPPSPIFPTAILNYIETASEDDLYAAGTAVAELLHAEDSAGVLQAVTAVHQELEASIPDTRGQRALELALTLNAPIWMSALSAPGIIRRLGFETAERQSLEQDIRAATLALARERELLEAHVQARTADLMAAKADLQTIVFLASHDLRTPANAIELSARVLQEELATSGSNQARLLVDEIVAGAQRILGRLQAFVELNRLEQRREDAVPVDFEPLIQSIWQARNPSGEIELQTAINVKSAQLEAGIFRAIIQELIDNALAHGGPALSVVAVRIRCEDSTVKLEVADNGRGVPVEARERILRPFETLAADESRVGNGIGLALVDKLLHLRNSALFCDADPILGGARFKAAMP